MSKFKIGDRVTIAYKEDTLLFGRSAEVVNTDPAGSWVTVVLEEDTGGLGELLYNPVHLALIEEKPLTLTQTVATLLEWEKGSRDIADAASDLEMLGMLDEAQKAYTGAGVMSRFAKRLRRALEADGVDIEEGKD